MTRFSFIKWAAVAAFGLVTVPAMAITTHKAMSSSKTPVVSHSKAPATRPSSHQSITKKSTVARPMAKAPVTHKTIAPVAKKTVSVRPVVSKTSSAKTNLSKTTKLAAKPLVKRPVNPIKPTTLHSGPTKLPASKSVLKQPVSKQSVKPTTTSKINTAHPVLKSSTPTIH